MPVLKIKKNGFWVEVWGSTGGGSGEGAPAPKLTTISMPVSAWSGDENPYYQVVSCNGVTAYSKIDLQPTPEQIITLQDAEISLMAANNNGTVIIYAIGSKPTFDLTMNALITEVDVV